MFAKSNKRPKKPEKEEEKAVEPAPFYN